MVGSPEMSGKYFTSDGLVVFCVMEKAQSEAVQHLSRVINKIQLPLLGGIKLRHVLVDGSQPSSES